MILETIRSASEQQNYDRISVVLRQLLGQSLTASESNAIVNQVASVHDFVTFKPFRIAISRSFTLEPLASFLKARCFAAGLDAEIRFGDFGTYVQDLLDTNGQQYAFKPDLLIIAIHTADYLPSMWNQMSSADSQEVVEQVAADVELWLSTFRSQNDAHVIIHNFEVPPYAAFGIFDAQDSHGQAVTVQKVNHRLIDIARNHSGVYILDYAGLVARRGIEKWYDWTKWLSIHMPMTPESMGMLADEYMRFICPITGNVSKALIVDLDNTLWGGVVGEEGIEGIKLSTTYPGIIYRNFQQQILNLYKRGIILGIASKNNYEDAMEVIESHPDMLLRPHHFAAIQINWKDKASNLRSIAEELNIGLSSLAFLDDNQAERSLVRLSAPEVAVIELPDHPLGFADALARMPTLDRLSLSEEDRKRSVYYADQRRRKSLKDQSTSLNAFFHSLDSHVYLLPASALTIPRIAQLTQKTNQFNLTTRRYSEQDIERMAADPNVDVFCIRVSDRFGDNGIVGISIVQYGSEQQAEIDTLLLSCRVIGRTIETALLSCMAHTAYQRDATRLVGWFIPTKKNKPAQRFFPDHGFVQVSTTEQGTLWQLDLTKPLPEVPEWITLHISEE